MTAGRALPVADPRTKKGRGSKEALLRAARVVFGRDGFAAARVSDVAAEAGMSNGAFYRYYVDKNAVLIELITMLLQQLYDESQARWSPRDPVESVVVTTERYFRFYARNADLFGVLHETMQTHPEIEAMQADNRKDFHERITRMIGRAVEKGLMRADVDPDLGAALLGGMTEHYAYYRFVLHRYPERDLGDVSRELAKVWAVGTFSEQARSDMASGDMASGDMASGEGAP
ncbi:TetR/AcrR family transcriptional regulator [Pseudonocardia sp. MH-G8]|uniref:TetR/AcrR family transcriptional regulator n=1 Tax=Pseudonocardia sp. MH-G8 TaxID=1854588 RepID=UPI0013043CB4|nr:TetR/AcrR family transcriptional regulator [Pseudonocardia sp. MH-G8]